MRKIVFCSLLSSIIAMASQASDYLFAQPNATSAPQIRRAGADKVPDEYIVVLNDSVDSDQVLAVANQLAATHGRVAEKVWRHSPKGFFVRMTDMQAELVSRSTLVKYVEENARGYLSAAQKTYVDPRSCDPVSNPNCPAVIDDRLWHLDRADQNLASPNDSYGYCTDGTDVVAYVVDTGVYKYHQEFLRPDGSSRVLPGFNASDDMMPADDPCMGTALTPAGTYQYEEGILQRFETTFNAHGTSVASVLGGRRVGVAKNVTIVPVKTARCDRNSARHRVSARLYQTNETMWPTSDGNIENLRLYRAQNIGYTSGTGPSEPWPVNPTPGQQIVDGTVTWVAVDPLLYRRPEPTTQTVRDALGWIADTADTSKRNIVNVSQFFNVTDAGVGVLEEAVQRLLNMNIPVIVSANNQNGNACDTTPARLSINNPDPAIRSDVITVGGSMIINRPWNVDTSGAPSGSVVANGHGPGAVFKGPEPSHNPNAGVREGRWICGKGDSAACGNQTDTATPPTSGTFYGGYTGGSNAGPCVTLFAPAKNIFSATHASVSGYRDARLSNELGSGTSFSAPIVTGVAARILQTTPGLSPSQLRQALLDNSDATLDLGTLAPRTPNGFPGTPPGAGAEILGTPNAVVRLSDVSFVQQPASRPGVAGAAVPLTVQAGGPALSYEWYVVNSTFDFSLYNSGAQPLLSSVKLAETSNTLLVQPQSSVKAYWVRVANSCGSADTNIAVVVPPPTGAPANVTATAAGTSVTVTWSAGTVSQVESYQVERKIAGQGWVIAGQVPSYQFWFDEVPAAPAGMVVYRVRGATGSAYLPSSNLALSTPSNSDFANTIAFTYEDLGQPPASVLIKGQHLIELRLAVNRLCDVLNVPQVYSAGQVALASLQGEVVRASDFTSLMSSINNVRQNSQLGLAAAAFVDTPESGEIISGSHIRELRDAIK